MQNANLPEYYLTKDVLKSTPEQTEADKLSVELSKVVLELNEIAEFMPLTRPC